MQRLMLVALASAGALACADAAAPAPADLSPGFAKSQPGAAITIAAIGPGSGGSEAQDVNDAGLVAGNTGTLFLTPSRAFLWTPAQPRGTTGTREDLGTLGGTGARAEAIDNAGRVVGTSATAAGDSHPFLWSRGGGLQDLGLGPGWAAANAIDINEAGQVAGIASAPAWQRAAVWQVATDATGAAQVTSRDTLPALPGGGNSIAKGMNGLGQVVGWSYVAPEGPNHAVMWTPAATGWIMEELGVLPGDNSSSAEGINDLGQVVGTSMPRQGCSRAVLWTTQGGRVTGMRALEGECPEAWAINAQSQVVGRMIISHRSEAAMWTLRADGSTAAVMDLGRLSSTASSLGIGLSAAIGGMTEVAGLSRAGGENRATLWTVR